MNSVEKVVTIFETCIKNEEYGIELKTHKTKKRNSVQK